MQCTPTEPAELPDSGCPNGACKEIEVSRYVPRSEVDWTSDNPEFVGLFQVIDERARPIEGAKIKIGERIAQADGNGDAPFDKLSAIDTMVVHAEHPDYLKSAFKTSYTTSGLQKFTVTLLRKPKPVTVATDKPVTLNDGDASWQFSQQPFQRLSGDRITDSVQVTMRTFAADSIPRSAIPGDRVAQAEDGSTIMIRKEIGLIMTEVTTMDGKGTRFAPGESAKLSVALPGSMNDEFPPGKKLGLYSLDEARAKWVKESSCEVQEDPDVPSGHRCVGRVEHFSYWLIADEFDVYSPDTFGCVNMVVDTSEISEVLEQRPGQDVRMLVHYPPQRCQEDGSCQVDWTFYYGQHGVLRPTTEAPYGSLCGVAEAADNYRMRAAVQVGGQLLFLFRQDFIVKSLEGITGSENLLNQQLDTARDCPTLCQQVVVKPTMEDLVAGLSDEDRDGFYAIEDPDIANTEQARGLDCDDQAPATYPGAIEDWCAPIDRNCDGHVPKEEPEYVPGNERERCTRNYWEVTDELPLCYFVWNERCDLECFKRTEERPGNYYDEDCDGLVLDADGDGFYSTAYASRLAEVVKELELEDELRPGDCNDYLARAYPGAIEVPGNYWDEDCDGIALDWDGDGYFKNGHEIAVDILRERLAEQSMNLDAGMPDSGVVMSAVELNLEPGDCNDEDPFTNPGISVEQEAGALASLFSGDVRRLLYCDYFDADGEPSYLFRRRVRDRNCDGVITDVDGDGLTVPGDNSLGEERAFDCNDYDARLIDECGTAYEATLMNESECEPASGADGNTGPAVACPLLESRLQTSCTMITPDVNMCLYPGWDTANPIRLTPGLLWGPCDGQGRVLPDCPAGSACGAPVPYSDELIDYLKKAFTDGADLEYQGICFRTCDTPAQEEPSE